MIIGSNLIFINQISVKIIQLSVTFLRGSPKNKISFT